MRFSSFELDTLIRDFLAEVLYFLQVEELVVEVLKLEQISDDEIEFQLSLYAIDLEQSQFIREVKAVTYHQLSVERMAVGYRAHVLLDL